MTAARTTEAPTRFDGRAMGSPLRLTFGSGTADPGDRAACWRAVVDEFELAEAAMSRFRDTSEITTLNRVAGTGALARSSPRLRRALVAADRAHRVSAGRFDPRVLVDLDRLGYRGAQLRPVPPSDPPDAPGVGRPSTGPVVERRGRHDVSIARPIDLGGIGKGLTLRWAADRLVRGGARDFLLEAGGDLVVRGLDPDGGRWQIGIEDPAGGDDLAVIAISDVAVATSSIQVNRWSVDGRTVHHLLDPRTGEPAEGGLVAVTVAGPDPAWAEVWSKVLFVGGRTTVAGEARARGLAAWWVTDDGMFEMTPAARAITLWVGAEATSAV